MNYHKYVNLIHKNCVSHTQTLERTRNFRNRLEDKLQELNKGVLKLEVKMFYFFTDKYKTAANITNYFEARKKAKIYTFSDSNVSKKISSQLEAYEERYINYLKAYTGKDKALLLYSIEKLKATL
jgi:hypothetical protein